MIDPTAKIHPLTVIHESVEIGANCVVWQFCSILEGVQLESDVSVGAGSEIGKGSVIGKGTRISAHVFLPSNSVVGRRCFLGPGARFADDAYPRASNPHYTARPPVIEDGASVGMNATVLPGVRIGVGAMVAAGAIVTRNVPAHEHVRGEPARTKALSTTPTHMSLGMFAAPVRQMIFKDLTEEERAKVEPVEREALERLAAEPAKISLAERGEYARHIQRWTRDQWDEAKAKGAV